MQIADSIIKNCQAGRSKAQRQLVDQSAPHLMRVALRYTHDRFTAQDVLQDSYIKIFEKIKTYAATRAPIGSWMRKIVIYTAIDKYRKKYWKNELELTEMSETKHFDYPNLDQQLDTKKIYALIDRLPFQHKTVFNLFAIEGYSHKEIAEILKIKEVTSRSHLNRARKTLQNQITRLELA